MVRGLAPARSMLRSQKILVMGRGRQQNTNIIHSGGTITDTGNKATGDVKYIRVIHHNDDVFLKPTDVCSVSTDTNDDAINTCTPVAQLSSLSYTDISVKNDDGKDDVSVSALVDSEAQLAVMYAELIQIHNPEVISKITLQPFGADAIDANWVRLKIQAKADPRATNTQTRTHTHTHNRFMALWILYRTTQVSQYQKKH